MDESITLVNDWDYQPKINSPLGHHVKRDQEHSIMCDFIVRKKEGSLLVCGTRGIGKTSSVIQAINDSLKINPKIKPVLIKAPAINFTEGDFKKNILQTLIRALYKETKNDKDVNDELKKKTAELYNKSIASEIKQEHTESTSSIQEITKKSQIKLIPILALITIGIISLTLDISDFPWLPSIVSVIIGGLFLYNFTKIHTKNSTKLASYHYSHDYTFSTMQSDTEEILEIFTKNNFKILFVMDELDKLSSVEPFAIIENLKMFINQGSALFIFITDPTILTGIDDRNQTKSTLFSQILFLKKPLFDEMRKFIDEITVREIELSDEYYLNLKNYLCYLSRTDFYSLYNEIRDLISRVDSEKGIILNSSLTQSQITQANLQRAIEWLYERKQYSTPSQWHINDSILNILYESVSNMEFFKFKQIIIDEKSVVTIGTNVLTPEKGQLIMDLLPFLVKQGYLRQDSDSQYTILGNFPKYHTDVRGIFVKDQMAFLDAYENFKKKIIHFIGIKTKWYDEIGFC